MLLSCCGMDPHSVKYHYVFSPMNYGGCKLLYSSVRSECILAVLYVSHFSHRVQISEVERTVFMATPQLHKHAGCFMLLLLKYKMFSNDTT